MAKLISAFIHIEQAVVFITTLLPIIMILTGNLDVTTWPLPVNLALPFKSDTILKWYGVYVIYLNMECTYGSSMIPTTALFVCSCIYISAICDHFEHVILSTNEDNVKMEQEKNPRKNWEIVCELHKKLRQSVIIHNRIYE